MDKFIPGDTSVYSIEFCWHEFGLWRRSNTTRDSDLRVTNLFHCDSVEMGSESDCTCLLTNLFFMTPHGAAVSWTSAQYSIKHFCLSLTPFFWECKSTSCTLCAFYRWVNRSTGPAWAHSATLAGLQTCHAGGPEAKPVALTAKPHFTPRRLYLRLIHFLRARFCPFPQFSVRLCSASRHTVPDHQLPEAAIINGVFPSYIILGSSGTHWVSAATERRGSLPNRALWRFLELLIWSRGILVN